MKRTLKIPDDKKILRLIAKEDRPMAVRELVRLLEVPAAVRPALRKRLRAMAEEGALVRVRGRYSTPGSLSIYQGVFRGHAQGYGFVVPSHGDDKEKSPDIMIKKTRTRGAMDGDLVSARVEKVHPDGRREGSVLDVMERAHETLVGRLCVEGRSAWVEPQQERIPHLVVLGAGSREGARRGEWVEVEITRYPTQKEPARGRVLRSFGYPEDPAAEGRMVLAKHGIREDFPKKVLEEEKRLSPPGEGDPFPEGVEDLRGLCAFTIDPFDARDRDDAVSIEKIGSGHRLGVHIADVGHYVKGGGAIDKEARDRGTSVYLPDRAVPMLPPRLTGEVCSLREGAVRRTLSVFIDFDRYGNRTGMRLTYARIRSRASLTYRGAAAVLEGGDISQENEAESARALEAPLRELAALAEKLHTERMRRGSLDFDLPEAQVLLDGEGMPTGIERAPRTSAHRLIEECMLAANRAVAEYLAEAGGASVFRIHEPPAEENLEGLRAILSRLGLKAPRLEALKRPGGFQEVFDAVRGSDVERYVNFAALRSMKLARYEAVPALHFGLGFERYTHFTSPIRRYADLCVHRRLGRLMRGDGGKPQAKPLAALCRDISEKDRTAEAASREMVDFMKALYMRDKVGERFRGHVSGVANFGIFVELGDIYVEGMVPLEFMTDDYYAFIPEEHAVLGRRTGRRFRLGDPVTVRVEGVDLASRRVTFQLMAGGTRELIGDAAESRRAANLAGARRPRKEKSPAPRRKKRGKATPRRGRRR